MNFSPARSDLLDQARDSVKLDEEPPACSLGACPEEVEARHVLAGPSAPERHELHSELDGKANDADDRLPRHEDDVRDLDEAWPSLAHDAHCPGVLLNRHREEQWDQKSFQ